MITLFAQLARLLAKGLYTPRRRAWASCAYRKSEGTLPRRRFTSPPSFKYRSPDETLLSPESFAHLASHQKISGAKGAES
jgi:hypothetical protein